MDFQIIDGDLGGRKSYYKTTVSPGSPEIIKGPPLNLSGTVIASGNTGLIETTTGTEAEIDAATAVWLEWDKGSVTGTETDMLIFPKTALRLTATGGDVDFEFAV